MNKYYEKIEKVITSFRTKMDDFGMIINPITLARQESVRIAQEKFTHPKLLGRLGYYRINIEEGKEPLHIICCSDTITPHDKKYAFVLSHELGHCFMYKEGLFEYPEVSTIFEGFDEDYLSNEDGLDEIELACNMFAREMLMPEIKFRMGVKHYVLLGRDIKREKNIIADRLSGDFNVPHIHVLKRGNELGVW